MTATENKSKSIWQRPVWVALFAFTAAFVWGWAYPFIKLGLGEFHISQDMTGSKMLFAGIRFAVSGVIILALAKGKGCCFRVANARCDWWFILLFAFLNTALHYACFYIGLSYSAGSRAAILNSMSVFTLVILACVFFPATDKFNLRKIIGCVLGFAGILALNLDGDTSGDFSLMGDGMIIANALCSAVAGLMTRSVSKRVDIFVGTGYSLFIGGVMLMIPALMMGGTLPNVTLWGIAILMVLIAISTIGFTLYNKLLSCNPVGKVAIFNSLIPVIGAVTSCACLHETFYWKYVIAAVFATAGIYIINRGKK